MSSVALKRFIEETRATISSKDQMTWNEVAGVVAGNLVGSVQKGVGASVQAFAYSYLLTINKE
jgi:hypothetical protein